jgi:hypothetical protein
MISALNELMILSLWLDEHWPMYCIVNVSQFAAHSEVESCFLITRLRLEHSED